MAINAETLRLSRRARADVNGVADGSVRTLTSAWVQAWDELAPEWNRALSQMASGEAWPSRAELYRDERAMRLLDATRDALDALEGVVDQDIIGNLPGLTQAGAEWEARLTATQMPETAGTQSQLTAQFNRVDPAALEAIVSRTTEQVHKLTWPLSVDAVQAMNGSLIRGVALGDNPRTTARNMLRRLEGDFNGGLARALNIARTEQLDVSRAAGRAQDIANTDVMAQWEWLATLDTRTCPSCLSQHGTRHALDERGPDDHQQGRCARVPVTKSWRELGFNLDEPPSVMPDARKWFDDLPEAGQLKVMGAERLELLRSGRIGWGDLTTQRVAAGWRTSWAPTPVKALRTVRTPSATAPSAARPLFAPRTPVARPKPTPVTRKPKTPTPVDVAQSHVVDIIDMPGEKQAARLTQQELLRQAEFTPKAMLNLKGVRVGDALPGVEGELAHYTFSERVIAMVARPGKELQDAFDYSREVGWFSKCGHDHDAFESVLAHEYGHHVEAVLRDMTYKANQKFWADAAEDLGVPAPTRWAGFDDRAWIAENRELLAERVSTYGATDLNELLAEVWAEYTTNPNARPHIKALGKRLQSVAERAAGKKAAK